MDTEQTPPKNSLLIGIIVTLVVLVGAGIFTHEELLKAKPNTNATPTSSPSAVATSSFPSPTTTTEAATPTPEPTFPPNDPSLQRFVVPLSATTTVSVFQNLLDQNLLTNANENNFIAVYNRTATTTPAPGAYKLSPNMTVTQMASVLHSDKPYMKWVVIPEGLRKEEIADLLAKTLGWSAATEKKWITTYTTTNPDYVEGVYFPDTYLIPLDETPQDTAARLIAHFNEKFSPFLPQFAAQNIKWTTGLTFASLVQREAANDADMPLIAGILWNRLNQNIALDIDATLQYARGNTGSGWWAPITVADKQSTSPYNTYKYKGLPPGPISNPGLPAIKATLNPTTTDCLYYLHDKDGVIHCAATYAEHQVNIQKYLVGN